MLLAAMLGMFALAVDAGALLWFVINGILS